MLLIIIIIVANNKSTNKSTITLQINAKIFKN